MAIQFISIPKRGDAVLGRKSNGEVLFVDANQIDFTNDTIDTTTYEKIGVVLRRTGKEVLIAYYQNASKKWSDRYSFKLTGYTLDGTARTGVLGIREASNSWASNVNYTVSYNASTVDDMITQLNTFFADTTNPVFQTQDWVAVKNADDSISLHFAYTDYRQASDAGSSGFTLTANLLSEITALADIRRKHGGAGGEGAISSWYKALAYYRNDNGTAASQGGRASVQTSVKQSYPINLPTWLGTSTKNPGDFCAALRAVYGEGEAGWLKFMQSCMPVNPTDYGNMGVTNGLELTKIMAQKTYTSPAKQTATPLCPAASYCHNIGTIAIPQGKWYLPMVRDVSDMLLDIKYNTHATAANDNINRILSWMSGTLISNGSGWWSCCRYGAGSAWHANGGGGFFGGYNFYVALGCVPVSLYKLA